MNPFDSAPHDAASFQRGLEVGAKERAELQRRLDAALDEYCPQRMKDVTAERDAIEAFATDAAIKWCRGFLYDQDGACRDPDTAAEYERALARVSAGKRENGLVILARTRAERDSLRAERDAYYIAFGPLVVGAERVKCLMCNRLISENAELSTELDRIRAEWRTAEAQWDQAAEGHERTVALAKLVCDCLYNDAGYPQPDAFSSTDLADIKNALRSTDEQAHRRGQEEALENIAIMARNGTQASGICKWAEDRLAELKAGEAVTVSEAVLRELLDDAERLEKEDWRHGYRQRFHVVYEGKDYALWLDVLADDGLQFYGGPYELTPVVKRERVITEWVAT